MIPGIIAQRRGGEFVPPGSSSEALWTPAEITTALWLDAADSPTIEIVSSAVSEWRDKSSNTRHATQGTAGNRPVVDAAALNGLDMIDFVGSEKRLIVPRGFITSQFSAFVVCSGGAENGRVLDQRGTGALGTVKGWNVRNWSNDADLATADDGAGNARQRTSTGGLDGSARISASLFPVSGLMEHYLNGVAFGTSAELGGAPTDVDAATRDILIGGSHAGTTQDFTGKIAEIVLLASAANTTIRQLIEGYLAHRWGLTGSLWGDHPYKSAAPTV